MLLILILSCIVFITVVLESDLIQRYLLDKHYKIWNMVQSIEIITVVSIILLGFVLICGTVVYTTYLSFPSEYKAIKMTIENARTHHLTDLERAALTTKIISINKELGCLKYWNNSKWVSIFIPDKAAELDYLE